jgi:hypothetical protein
VGICNQSFCIRGKPGGKNYVNALKRAQHFLIVLTVSCERVNARRKSLNDANSAIAGQSIMPTKQVAGVKASLVAAIRLLQHMQ